MIESIKYIKEMQTFNLPANEFILINSVWLAVTGLRMNGDLDILISSQLRKEMFPDKDENLAFGLPGPLEKRIRIHSTDSIYGQLFDVKSIDEVIYQHFVEIDSFKFVEPRFYFEYKSQRLKKNLKKENTFPWWRKVILKDKFCKDYNTKKFFKKLNKDKQDILLLQTYFNKQLYLNKKEFKHLNAKTWGIEIIQALNIN